MSINKSSSLMMANASSTSKPYIKALTKSAAFWIRVTSSVFAGPYLDVSSFQIKPDLQFEMLDDWLKNLHPVFLQWRISVTRYWNFSDFCSIRQLLLFDGWKGRFGHFG